MSQSKHNTPTPPATEEEIATLREEFDEMYIAVSTYNGDRTFHIPDEEGQTLCIEHTNRMNSNGHRLKPKPLDAYPPGWNPWCKHCLDVWREQEEE